MRWLTEVLFIYLLPLAILIVGGLAKAGLFVTIVVPLIIMFASWLYFRKPTPK